MVWAPVSQREVVIDVYVNSFATPMMCSWTEGGFGTLPALSWSWALRFSGFEYLCCCSLEVSSPRTWMIWQGSREFIVVPIHAWTWRGIKLAWSHRALWQNDSHVHFVLDTDTYPVCLMVMFTANYNNIKTSKESHDGSFGPFPHNIFSCCFVSPTPQLQTRETHNYRKMSCYLYSVNLKVI